MKDYLVRGGISSERLHAISFGKDQPLASGHTAVAYAQNRRADFRLMRGNVRLVLENGSLVDDRGRPLAERRTTSSTAPGRKARIARR